LLLDSLSLHFPLQIFHTYMFMSLLYVITFVRGSWAFYPLSYRTHRFGCLCLQVSLFIHEDCLSFNDSPRQLHHGFGKNFEGVKSPRL